MKLGILIKDDKVVNHRSLLKVLLNPILRYFGYYIGSIFYDNQYIGIQFAKCEKSKYIKYDFMSMNDYDYIIKKHILF